METKNSQRRISETIRKIALACSIDRVDMSHCKTGGVETARVILIRLYPLLSESSSDHLLYRRVSYLNIKRMQIEFVSDVSVVLLRLHSVFAKDTSL